MLMPMLPLLLLRLYSPRPQRLPPTGPPLFRPTAFGVVIYHVGMYYMHYYCRADPQEKLYATVQSCTSFSLKQVFPKELQGGGTSVCRDWDIRMVSKLIIHYKDYSAD